MVRLDRLLTAAYFVSLFVAFGGVVVIASGNARPFVDPTELPVGVPVVILGFAVFLLAGAAATSKLTGWLWRRAASRAGLRPVETGDGSDQVFGDTRRGHPVRVRTISGRDGDSGFTLTMVEALLADRQTAGVVVEPDGADGVRAVGLGDAPLRGDGLAVASDDPEFASAVRDGLTPATLSAPGRLGQVYAGDTAPLLRSLSDPDVLDTHDLKVRRALARDGTGEGVAKIKDELGAVGDVLRDEIDGLGTDAATVVHYTAGPVLDGEELDRQVDAVVDVADAIDGR